MGMKPRANKQEQATATPIAFNLQDLEFFRMIRKSLGLIKSKKKRKRRLRDGAAEIITLSKHPLAPNLQIKMVTERQGAERITTISVTEVFGPENLERYSAEVRETLRDGRVGPMTCQLKTCSNDEEWFCGINDIYMNTVLDGMHRTAERDAY